MSWNRSYETRTQFNVDSPAYQSGTPDPQQLAEARAAAEGILSSGVIPGSEDAVNITIYGHANDGHPNSAPDAVSVSVAAKAK